jgi:hypothetical protein
MMADLQISRRDCLRFGDLSPIELTTHHVPNSQTVRQSFARIESFRLIRRLPTQRELIPF